MGDTATRTDDGLQKIYPSCRPHGTTTYFSGAGDTTEIGQGSRLLFSLTAQDTHKVVDISYRGDVYLKDGYMITDSAPFGAYLDVEIVHPVLNVVVGTFCKKVPIFGSGWFPLDTEDRSLIPVGMIIRITVYNSSGEAPEDSPAAFKLAGRIEMYRKDA